MQMFFSEKKFSSDVMNDLCPDGLSATVDLLSAPLDVCRWPYDDLRCCGRPVAVASSYCPVHAARAHGRSFPPVSTTPNSNILPLSLLDLI